MQHGTNAILFIVGFIWVILRNPTIKFYFMVGFQVGDPQKLDYKVNVEIFQYSGSMIYRIIKVT